jgi:hypothetical protein
MFNRAISRRSSCNLWRTSSIALATGRFYTRGVRTVHKTERLSAVFGSVTPGNPPSQILHQLYSILDGSSARAVADIAASTGKPTANAVATVVGIAVALFGASGVFGQLQDTYLGNRLSP